MTLYSVEGLLALKMRGGGKELKIRVGCRQVKIFNIEIFMVRFFLKVKLMSSGCTFSSRCSSPMGLLCLNDRMMVLGLTVWNGIIYQ